MTFQFWLGHRIWAKATPDYRHWSKKNRQWKSFVSLERHAQWGLRQGQSPAWGKDEEDRGNHGKALWWGGGGRTNMLLTAFNRFSKLLSHQIINKYTKIIKVLVWQTKIVFFYRFSLLCFSFFSITPLEPSNKAWKPAIARFDFYSTALHWTALVPILNNPDCFFQVNHHDVRQRRSVSIYWLRCFFAIPENSKRKNVVDWNHWEVLSLSY